MNDISYSSDSIPGDDQVKQAEEVKLLCSTTYIGNIKVGECTTDIVLLVYTVIE